MIDNHGAESLPLNLEWLESFVVFSDHLNFTRAARARGLSQPALHVHVRKLTEQLGVELYARRGRRLELTAAGREVAAVGREFQIQREELFRRVRGQRDAAPVVMCAGEGAFLYLLGDAIRRYRDRELAPLQLMARDAAGTALAVATGAAHLGVASLPSAADDPETHALVSELCLEPVADVGHVLVMPGHHPLAGRRRLRLQELAHARLVVPPRGRPLRTAIDRLLADADVPWEVAVEVTGWPLTLHFVALGVGLAFVNEFCRLPRGLTTIPAPQLGRRTYDAMRRASAPPRDGVEALWSLLVGA
ncbi:MAG: LysR family transcriptional regulator [Myxococcales bacterium]|nr:LysR family transcriptional regulator [Myxococcales bacterium]